MTLQDIITILDTKIPLTTISIMNVITAIIILLVGYVVAGYVGSYIKRAMLKAKLAAILANFTSRVARILIIIFVVALAIGFLGVDVGSAVISFSVVSGFILGFAFQETLGNLAAGFMIAITKPFKSGDYVDVAGNSGSIAHVGASITTLITVDNKRIIIPNAKVWGEPIVNYTALKQRMIMMSVGISYSDDMSKAIELVIKVLKDHKKVLKDPSPLVAVDELGDSSVNIVVRPWVQTSDYWTTKRELTQSIKETFDKNGISIPFPQRDVHFYKE
jgi:small conductance mechanosensitive channel